MAKDLIRSGSVDLKKLTPIDKRHGVGLKSCRVVLYPGCTQRGAHWWAWHRQDASGHGVECVWCDAAQQEGAVLLDGGLGQCAGARKADEQTRAHCPEFGATGFGGAR